MWAIGVVLVACAAAADVTDEQFASLPRLYQLDDYEGCLAARGGLYCLGSFHASPAVEPHPIYDLMRAYSSHPLRFNRTQLHRGYCVSARCDATASQTNSSLRFEQCAQQMAQSKNFYLELTQLHYCRTHEEARTTQDMDLPQVVFLSVVASLLLLNIAGTAYDLIISDDEKKNEMVIAWSVRVNWQRLTAARPHDDDPRLDALQPLHGLKVVVLASVIWTHAGFVHLMLYTYNPRALENLMRHPMMMAVKNGTALVQIFVLLTSFLLAHNLLLGARRRRLTLAMLPSVILNRVIRITPLYLLVVGYAATWWPRAADGPMWGMTVTAESQVCRRKFWTHALYVNNLVNAEEHCLVQTWFLAVDLQLYTLAAVLTLSLSRLGRYAIPILGAMFLASCLMNAALAYAYHWKTMMFIMTPETLRMMFRGEPSFSQFYTSPWGSLPASLLGLFVAHLHYHLQEAGFKASEHRWLVWGYHLYFPVGLAWIMAGIYIQDTRSRLLLAAHVALERPFFAALTSFFLFGVFNRLDSFARDVFSWERWRVLARLSLSALLLHWCVNMLLAGARPQPFATSLTDIMTDWVATGFFTYLLAVPATILVELPVQRLAATLMRT